MGLQEDYKEEGMGMEKKTITVVQNDGFKTAVTACLADGEPKASIVVFHGMAEHHLRYLDFAEFMTSNGYDVYLYDHRGHGKDVKLEELGFIAEKDGDRLLYTDAINITKEIRSQARGGKFFLFGHSMGSFICRIVIQEVDDIDGAVICGTNYPDALTKSGGGMVTGIVKAFKGAHHVSPFINKMMFENKEYLSVSTRTVMDWLSRDNNVVGAYINDPYCGFVCTASFYCDLIGLIKRAGKSKMQLKTRKDLPMFFIAGDHDPVGGFGKQVEALVKFYEKNGYTAVSKKIYEGARHELLNETNKKEVYDDILNWYNER